MSTSELAAEMGACAALDSVGIYRSDDRIGYSLQTFTRRMFWPQDPHPEEVDIIDIAHALSNLCRFCGHSRVPYSVAQHSCLVSHIVPPELALVGLMHDATEAYCGDLIRPIKTAAGMDEYHRTEARIWAAIAKRFGLPRTLPDEVNEADRIALATEVRDVMGGQVRPWRGLLEPLPQTIVPWSAELAEREFLTRFRELTEVVGDGDGNATMEACHDSSPVTPGTQMPNAEGREVPEMGNSPAGSSLTPVRVSARQVAPCAGEPEKTGSGSVVRTGEMGARADEGSGLGSASLETVALELCPHCGETYGESFCENRLGDILHIEQSANPGAALKLAHSISCMSEEHWRAGWLNYCEFSLWRRMLGSVTTLWGMSEVSVERLAELGRLSDQCGGWIRWEWSDRPEFVQMDEWRALYAAHIEAVKQRGGA